MNDQERATFYTHEGEEYVRVADLLELVEEWREGSNAAPLGILNEENKGRVKQLEKCADELEAVLEE